MPIKGSQLYSLQERTRKSLHGLLYLKIHCNCSASQMRFLAHYRHVVQYIYRRIGKWKGGDPSCTAYNINKLVSGVRVGRCVELYGELVEL